MRTLEELLVRLRPYGRAEYCWFSWGHVAWHVGTGENVELLFIEVKEQRRGFGTRLLRAMANRLLAQGEPYNSVYAFRRTDREEAGKFYAAMGFEQRDLGESIYRGVGTTIMWVGWHALLRRLGLEEQS